MNVYWSIKPVSCKDQVSLLSVTNDVKYKKLIIKSLNSFFFLLSLDKETRIKRFNLATIQKQIIPVLLPWECNCSEDLWYSDQKLNCNKSYCLV